MDIENFKCNRKRIRLRKTTRNNKAKNTEDYLHLIKDKNVVPLLSIKRQTLYLQTI